VDKFRLYTDHKTFINVVRILVTNPKVEQIHIVYNDNVTFTWTLSELQLQQIQQVEHIHIYNDDHVTFT
jgi:hypothetical protein